MMGSIGRILVADDHPLVREGLSLAARAALPGASVDGASTIGEAEALLKENGRTYRLILLDLILPDARGFSGFMKLQHIAGTVPIVIISAQNRIELIAAARALGASAYLSKAVPLDDLAGALRQVLAGQSVFPPEASQAGPLTLRDRIATLSGAQLRVLLAMADGRLNKQLADDLGVTESTIKAHLTAIFRKLGVNNRTQAILAVQPLLGEAGDEPV